MGQTNEQQRRFNEWPIIKLHGEVDSIKPVSNYFLTSSNHGMSSLPLAPGEEGVKTTENKMQWPRGLSLFPVEGKY
jgi:hypothetical protein